MKKLSLVTLTAIILFSVIGLSETLANPTKIITDSNPLKPPQISGNYIVWMGFHNEGSFDIYLYDISTGIETQITKAGVMPFSHQISGNRIVWHALREGTLDIYLYDIKTRITTQITNDMSPQGYPAI